MEKDTVSIHFVRAAVARLAAPARARVLAIAGIAPELLAADAARVTADAFAALWLAVSHEIDDEFFGLDSRRMKVGSFAFLSAALLPAARLDRAVRRLLRGFALIFDDIGAELRLDGDTALIELHNRIADREAARFADETLLVMIHGLMCWLAGQRIPLDAAEFAHPAPMHAREYAVMFSQQLRFDAGRTAIRFNAALLALPVVQNETALKAFLRSAPQSVFLKYKNEESWTARLRRRLRASVADDLPAEWPLLDEVAREFRLAPTTLRRRLDAEGSSYKAIKDQLRRDAAIHHLCNGSLSVAEIASRLGFQEPSAFHRAFKKWSGVQPGEYRQRQRQAS